MYAFSYIEQVLSDQRYSLEEKQQVEKEALNQINVSLYH